MPTPALVGASSPFAPLPVQTSLSALQAPSKKQRKSHAAVMAAVASSSPGQAAPNLITTGWDTLRKEAQTLLKAAEESGHVLPDTLDQMRKWAAPVMHSSDDMKAYCAKVDDAAKAKEKKEKKPKGEKGTGSGRKPAVNKATFDAAIAVLARFEWDIFNASSNSKGLSLDQLKQLCLYKGVYEKNETNKMQYVKLLIDKSIFDADKAKAAAEAAADSDEDDEDEDEDEEMEEAGDEKKEDGDGDDDDDDDSSDDTDDDNDSDDDDDIDSSDDSD